jgi:ubiquinol-cytochrome c reductase iron-sulfur subunit
VLERRPMLRRLLALAVTGFGVAALFPIRSLGPRPGTDLLVTGYRGGRRLVDVDNTPIVATEVPVGGLVTAFPEDQPGSADGQTVLIRLDRPMTHPAPGREDWTPDNFVAFSKICTHAGCPVGLYEAQSHTLLCPCHQSLFDVMAHATPTSGPAAAPLPQLPLRINDNGEIESTGDFSDAVGPTWWDSPE